MNIRLMEPWLLVLALALVPALLWRRRQGPQREARVRFSTLGVLTRLPVTARVAWQPVLLVLRVLALLLVVLALTRPAVTRVAEASPRNGVDLVLAVDISYSMSEHDLGPKSRLETAKDTMQEFISGRQGDRIGLVAFAGAGVSVSPLTSDYPVLLGLLSQVNHGKLPEGTAIGNGLATALNLVREGQGKSRVVVVLTDGQNNAGEILPEAAAKLAQTLNVRVYTIGVGAAARGGATLRGGRTGFTGDSIDEELLRNIAESTGGAYFRATDQDALKQVYATIDRLEKSDTGTQRQIEVQDLSIYALLGALALLFLEVALQNTLFRKAP